MKKLKKILIGVVKLSLLVVLLITMGFVNSKQESLPYSKVDVNINTGEDLFFIDRNDVIQLLHNRGDSIIGETKKNVSIPEIESTISNHRNVAKAEVYSTIDGTVKIIIDQRKPVIRIINKKGDSYYIDEEGMLMPLSNKHTAKVPIATGYIYETYAMYYKQPVDEINDSLKDSKNTLDKLYNLAKYVKNDTLWRAQIQQMYVNKKGEIELYPLVGEHKIIFGDTINMHDKFQKLYIFYTQGLNTTGWWDKYATINLKYKNQIVCTKK